MTLAQDDLAQIASTRFDAAHGAVRSISTPDPAAAWLSLCAARAAPSGVGSMLELDGYLTGVIVAPDLIRPRDWISGLWREDDAVFDHERQLTMALGSVMARYNTLNHEIDAGLQQLKTERVCGWRPVFQPASGKADHAAVRQWAQGFWKAATLAPEGWNAYVEDERTRIIVTPLIGFAPFDLGQNRDPADTVDSLLDEAATAIPHSVLLLRMIAQMRAERPKQRANDLARVKIGRNDPCPCGSDQKYKRCCGGA